MIELLAHITEIEVPFGAIVFAAGFAAGFVAAAAVWRRPNR